MKSFRDWSITGDIIDDASGDIANILADKALSQPLSDAERSELEAAVRLRVAVLAESIRQQVTAVTSEGANRQRSERTMWTPPELARAWGVSPDKVLGWIRSGELAATNIGTSQKGRPRYRIDPSALAAFVARRTTQPAPVVTRRPRKLPDNVIKFF